MNRLASLFSLLILLSFSAFAQDQTGRITGVVKDSVTNEPVIGAYVAVSRNTPDAKPEYVTTDIDGKFSFNGLSKQAVYLVKVSYLSYKDASRTITLQDDNQDVGTFQLSEAVANLKEIKVVGQVTAMEQKGDTTQFNAAAFKTNPDATSEDLIQKMPGITVTNGTVTAHGETVNRVLVDGKPFFGEDAALTLKSLPAEIVDKIEVFDKLSDQAQFTGFDDGNGQKTINIVTKADRKMGQFGKVFAGYGLDNRYQAGGNVSFFKDNQRISVIGLSNNINMQNFSSQDLIGVSGGGGGGGRGGSGGGGSAGNFLVGNQSGITGTNSFGLNYANKFGKKVDVTGSYFFNRTGNSNLQSMQQRFILPGDTDSTDQIYNENSRTNNTNANHRLNFRIEYNINKNNSLIITPRLSFQDNNSVSTKVGLNTSGNGLRINSLDNNQRNATNAYNFNNDVLFRHSFEKKGRTLSVNLNTQLNDRNGIGNLYSRTMYFDSLGLAARGDTLDQQSFTYSNGLTLGGNLIYTEPIGKNSQLQFNYGLTVSNSDSKKETYNMSFDENTYSDLDSLLSNTFDNRYVTNRAGIGYRYRKNSWSANFGLDFQNTGLYSQQLAPINAKVDQSFTNLLPNFMLSYRSKAGTQFRTFFRSSTNQPSISQLQNVIDNSNPLALTAGNPDLKQEYRNIFNVRYSLAGAERPYSLNAMIFVTQTNNAIVNSTLIAQEPTEVANGIILERGAKFTKPVNVDGSWNARTFLAYGKPVAPLKLNVNLTTGFNYVRSPGLINNTSNFSNTYAVSQGLVISSNVSENLDFTVSYSGNYNMVRNTIQPNLNNNYYTQGITGRVNWIFGKGFVVQSDISNQSYRGLGEGYNQNFTLWNASVGKKFLKNNAGELKLTVFDILKQNNSITRNVTETYVQDVTNRVLTQYAMLTFTYTLRNFGKAPAPENNRRRDFEGGDMPGGGRGGRGDRGGFN
ncbi:TonB-dependent receptor [Dyadobacter fanqingshengii]|uniref:Outer membrane beta-barrel protein n=1 Tax=Dyadobacter fanqingshengii TaxID=2906443 RepID=A0A9X1TBJ9_9BACT|nr:TonB-dependent receptor [Dyadobacter fanqingshengii]MCF0042648.1 outer membrane beta-barrel protein [Dyadobacter fanqingshengii]USJ36127.1 outer membrane beta-barrel protein [Dyadobacter fanqingshengii]